MLSNTELEVLSNLDICTVNKNQLKELTDIKIDMNLPINQRIENFFDSIGNPFLFKVNGTAVKIAYNDCNSKTLDECLLHYLTNKNNSN